MEWFESWFNTPYYHILYKHRDDTEAQAFLRVLMDHLDPEKSCRILDLACGRGRHSIYLSSLGCQVTGYDISPESIEFARERAKGVVRFEVKDMREPYGECFDLILNLFTSFGYFETPEEHHSALQCVAEGLNADGRFILDFMNVKKILLGLVEEEIKLVDGIEFRIHREVHDGQIIKSIKFQAKGKGHHYEERVQAFSLTDLSEMLEKAGLQIRELFGDYELNPFNALDSDRLIIVAGKRTNA
jgi:SAM-dependent methyltransferase